MTTNQDVDFDHPRVTMESVRRDGPAESIPDFPIVIDSWDQAAWMNKLLETQRRVCRLFVHHNVGTGFLVARNVVLTNYHVVKRLLTEGGTGDGIQVRFDYQPAAGDTPETGELHQLDREWCIAHAVDSAADDDPGSGLLPASDELDYALLRLQDAPGDERGCVPVLAGERALTPGSPLCILQYVEGSLELAFSPDGAKNFNANHTRLRHRVNTADRSSGSPVFDKDWTLVALHRGFAGQPPGETSPSNDAIPIAKIRDHFLRKHPAGTRERAEVGWG